MFANSSELTGCLCVLALLLCAGCGETQQTSDAGAGHCQKGLKGVGKACVPVFDDCKDDEIPLLGGGCKKVGVEECAGGIKGPPDWKCTPIGVPTPCKSGWRRHAKGYCEPILPAATCPDGSMAVIGKTTCQPIGDCGSGTWGKIKTSAGTLFVDGSYTGGSSDGSQTRPFTSIKAALARVGNSGHVAVAAGTYLEDLKLDAEGVTLEGRCASTVLIKGQGAAETLLVMKGGVTLRGLTVTGPQKGISIWVAGGKSVVERVAVQNTGNVGILLYASATVRDTQVKGAKESGVLVEKLKVATREVEATLERVVVRGTTETALTPLRGFGVSLMYGVRATIRDSWIAGNHNTGVGAVGSTVVLERTAVSGTKPDPLQNVFGIGVSAYTTSAGGPSGVTARDCLLMDNVKMGVNVSSVDLTLERTAVIATKPSPADSKGGYGVVIANFDLPTQTPKLTLRDCLVADNEGIGMTIVNSEATVEGTVVRDTRPQSSKVPDYELSGEGLRVELKAGYARPPALTVRDSLVQGNHSYGISAQGASVTLQRVVIRDTRPASQALWGAGLGAFVALNTPSKITLEDCLVTGNHRFGLVQTDTTTTLKRTLVRDTKPGTVKSSAGFGIDIRSTAGAKMATSLEMAHSIVARNVGVGIYLQSVKADILGSVVRDTRAEVSSGGNNGRWGLGLDLGQCAGCSTKSTLTMRESLVQDNRAAGLSVSAGTTASIARSVVRRTLADSAGHGDGIAIGGGSTAQISDSLVEQSARAGILFEKSTGSVRRSVVRGGDLSIALCNASAPTIGEDNELVDNKQNQVTRDKILNGARHP